MLCPSCGTENPDGFKFCGGCGSRLAPVAGDAPAPPPRPAVVAAEPERQSEERKIVTVLFTDIQGFTALSEFRDPEEVRDLIQRLFARLTDIITRCGGTVDKYIGDCIMALFGAPVAHENDPERAIRASLEMTQEVRRFSVDEEISIHMRIGINTGMVLAGYIGDRSGDYTVMGDDVNLASRLEKAAPVDGILISQKTHDHVRSLFEFESLDPILVKGKRDPVKVYRVLREQALTSRYSRGRKIESRMVGRESEMERMLAEAHASAGRNERRFLLITAPAGVGKSRLLYEFHQAIQSEDRAGKGLRLLKGRSLPYATNIPYYLFGSLLKDLCGILDEDSAADARAKLLAGVSAVLRDGSETSVSEEKSEEITHLMASLLNIEFPGSPHVTPLKKDPIRLNQHARAAFVEFFRHAAEEPLVVYLEDFHWAEQSSMDLAVDIFQDSRHRPLLFVAAARPEFFERFPEAPLIFPAMEHIELKSLPIEAVRVMMRDLLKRVPAIPDAVERLVIEKTEGNPYYVEEMIKMLHDAGVVQRGESADRIVEERLGEIDVPDTIQGLLQARLDNLTVNEKGVLQRASVVGRTFWTGALTVLLEGLTISRAEPVLRDLSEKGFIFDTHMELSLFMGAEYIFKHALLRDVTYQTILKKTRAPYHAILADWIEKNGGDRKEEFLSVIAMHHELGGNRERAREFYYLAGERARLTYANAEALSYFDRMIALSDRPSFSHLRRRGGVREILGDYDGALSDYRVLAEIATSSIEKGVAAKHLAEIQTRLGNYAEARQHAEEAARIGEEADDARMVAETYNIIGRIHDYTGRTDLALDFYTRSMEAHRREGNTLGEATGLGNIGIIHMYRGEYGEAIAAYKAALELDRAAGNKRRMTIMMSNLGEVYQFLGAMEEAEAYHREALTISRTILFRMMQVEILRNLGLDRVHLGRHEEGLAMMREALEMAEDLKDMELLPQVLYSLGEGLVIAERREEALPFAVRLLEMAESRDVKDFIAKGILLKSSCHAGVEELERGLRIAEELASRSLLWEFHAALARRERGTEEARRHLDAAKAEIDAVAGALTDAALREKFLAARGVKEILNDHAREVAGRNRDT